MATERNAQKLYSYRAGILRQQKEKFWRIFQDLKLKEALASTDLLIGSWKETQAA